jgi:multidrug efflux pump subunit AcrA (membrane-fusion protein)
MRNGARLGFAAIAAVLIAAAAFTYVRFDGRKPPAAGPRSPIPIVAAKVEWRREPIVRTGLGVVTPLIAATIRSQIIGLLTDVDLKEGQFVEKGERLARSVRKLTGRPDKGVWSPKGDYLPVRDRPLMSKPEVHRTEWSVA